MDPKVSILIPTFNRAGYLRQAIESALRQDYSNLEVIVSDNASTDDTREVVSKFSADPHLRYHRNNVNLGMIGNWRQAVRDLATGDWFLLLSDDDYLIDDAYISKAMKIAEGDADIHLVYASGYIRLEYAARTKSLDLPFNDVEDGKTIFLSRGTVYPQDFTLCNVLFRRATALSLDAFSNDLDLCGDSALFLAHCLAGRIGVCRDRVSVYRIHEGNLINAYKHDFLILMASADWCIDAWRRAKESGQINQDELCKWNDRVVLATARVLLLRVAFYHKPQLKEALEGMDARRAGLSSEAFELLSFRLELKLALRLSPALYDTLFRIKLRLKKTGEGFGLPWVSRS